MEFWRYYEVLRRRRWLVAATVLAAMVLAVGINRPTIGDYAATANLALPSMQQFAVVSGLPGLQQLGGGVDRSPLAVEFIKSRDVAERAAQQIGNGMRPEDLQRRLTVEKDPITNLIKVTATGRSPREAVMLASVVAQAASGYDQEVQRRGATLAREFIEKQTQSTQAGLRSAEDTLLAFQQQNGMALAAPQNAQVAGLQNAAQQVSVSLRETEARLAADRAQMSGQPSSRADARLEDNPIARELRAQLVQLEVQLTSEQAIHTDKYPSVIALKAKIDAIKDRLKSEVGRVVSAENWQHNPIYDGLLRDRINLETERVALLARQEAIQGALDTAARALPDTAQKQMERDRLARTVDILGKQYAGMQSQLNDARLREQEAQVLGSLSVVDLPRGAVPSPFRGLQFKLTLALVLGLIGGASLAFFLEYLDGALGTPEGAERLLGLPVLGAIPRNNPAFLEAYRGLRVHLTAVERPSEIPVLAVTGARPSGGTSTVVANLARAFAQAGRRTVIVDTDFRRPSQQFHFATANDTGLMQVLAGEASLADTIVPTHVPNLALLPSGALPGETGDLLCSPRMGALLDQLKARADVVLLDTPPAGAFPDVLSMVPFTTGVVLVLGARQAPRGTELEVKSQLTRLGARLLGVVLTKVRPDLVDAYVYQAQYYSKGRSRRLSPATGTATAGAIVIICLGLAAGLLAGASSRSTSLAHTVAHSASAVWAQIHAAGRP